MLSALLGAILFSYPAWAWFAEGHEIVAAVAADDLKPAARSHVARILGVKVDADSVAKAMEAASIRPDTEFRNADPLTALWHFVDICLRDREHDLSAQCPHGNCVTARINEYGQRLQKGDYDKWGAAGDLAFLIHLVGDIHQPLHTASNGDRGGTCQQVDVAPAERNLHHAWDDAVVVALEKQLGTHDAEATARKLEALYPVDAKLGTWKPGESEQIAWESHQLAQSEVYRRLGIPERPWEKVACHPATRVPVTLSTAYMEREGPIAGRQLAKAGHRLAALLNQIWSP